MEIVPYNYKPMTSPESSIRLLSLRPKHDGMLCLTLQAFALGDSEGTYDAISYEWDPSSNTKQVLVDGCYLQVRENIWNFLDLCYGRLQGKHHEKLWIDSICIDQANTSEKNHQVRQMGRIFAKARCVIAWLGEASMCKAVGTYSARNAADHLKYPGNRTEWVEFLRHSSRWAFPSRTLQNEVIRDIERLYESSYWTRLWIIQELALAKIAFFVAGHEVFSFAMFRSMASYLPTETRHKQERLGNIPSSTAKPRACTYLPEFVSVFSARQCYDQRDHVYAFLSLVEGGDNFDVDYDIDIVELFCRALSFTLKHSADGTLHAADVFALASGLSMSDRQMVSIASPTVTETYLDIEIEVERLFVRERGLTVSSDAEQHFEDSHTPWLTRRVSCIHSYNHSMLSDKEKLGPDRVLENEDRLSRFKSLSKVVLVASVKNHRQATVYQIGRTFAFLLDMSQHKLRLCYKEEEITGVPRGQRLSSEPLEIPDLGRLRVSEVSFEIEDSPRLIVEDLTEAVVTDYHYNHRALLLRVSCSLRDFVFMTAKRVLDTKGVDQINEAEAPAVVGCTTIPFNFRG